MAQLTNKEIEKIAEEAYIYSFAMLMGYRFAFTTFLAPGLPSYRGPVNAIYGKAATLDHTYKDVITPNSDTPYSLGMLDLRAEPAVIQVPEVTDRYYVLQFEDLYGCNEYFVGSRATGSKAGTYLAVGPGWDGEAGDEFDAVLQFETEFVYIIGRTQLLGADDVDALDKVMDAYKVQTLSAYRGQSSPAAQSVEWPVWNDEASRDERFIGYLNFLLQFCQPTPASEEALMARFAQIGIGAGRPFDADTLSDDVRNAIRSGVDAARQRIADKVLTMGKKVNGWTQVDVFGSREWYDGDFLLRSAGAMSGWGGNDTIEAMYPTAREDADGQHPDGAYRYQIAFTTPPPTRAFWSVTMYDTTYDGTAGYLVENPINRYLINSTTEGLVYGEDGSLILTIQREQPQDAAEKANWLPAPEGPFYLVLRIYWPEQAALDGTWTPPPVAREDRYYTRRQKMSNEEFVKLAAEAYVYGYPMVYTIEEQIKHTEGGYAGGSPVNVMGYTDQLFGPETDFVSVNNDNLYMMLEADVTQEPLVLHVPDTNDRYYVLQFVDAWTNNFAYIGRRATGTKEGFFLLAGPDWQGDVPDGVTLVRAPTNIFHIVGRYAVFGEKDVPATRALLQDTWVTPLSRYPERADTSQRKHGDWDLAPWNREVGEALAWWEKFRAWSQLFPPPAAERDYIQKFESLGLLAKESPYIDPDPDLAQVLQVGQKAGQEFIETASKAGGEMINGWAMITHLFDYNLDSFALGTIDKSEWKMTDRAKAHVARAIAARLGLWGNHAYEAAYAFLWTDEHGESLNGAQRYVLHFDELPPAEAFWSLTMYDAVNYYLVANPIKRYSIGDRTPGIQYNDDGSLDLYLQHDSPGPDKESNWLPAPEGNFRPTLRMYQPGAAVLDGSWLPPSIKRLD